MCSPHCCSKSKNIYIFFKTNLSLNISRTFRIHWQIIHQMQFHYHTRGNKWRKRCTLNAWILASLKTYTKFKYKQRALFMNSLINSITFCSSIYNFVLFCINSLSLSKCLLYTFRFHIFWSLQPISRYYI